MLEDPFRIFVSYSRRDDRIPPDDPSVTMGFVKTVCRRIEHELGDFLPQPALWWDREFIENADQFDPVIADAIQGSSVFVIVASNNWLQSEYCRYELDLFRKRWWFEDDYTFKHRIVLARKTQVSDPLP